MGLAGEEYLRSRTPRLVRQGGVLRREGLPFLLIRLDQTLQDKPQAVRILQASAAAQANAETLRDKLPHHFPVPVGHFHARHPGQLLHCPRQLRLLRPAKCGGEPPVCSNIKAPEPALVKTGPSLAEGGGPSADGVSIPAQRLGGARGGQAPAQEPQCAPPFSLPGAGAGCILLRTPARSNCHPSKSGPIPLIPITIPAQPAPSPDAMPP